MSQCFSKLAKASMYSPLIHLGECLTCRPITSDALNEGFRQLLYTYIRCVYSVLNVVSVTAGLSHIAHVVRQKTEFYCLLRHVASVDCTFVQPHRIDNISIQYIPHPMQIKRLSSSVTILLPLKYLQVRPDAPVILLQADQS